MIGRLDRLVCAGAVLGAAALLCASSAWATKAPSPGLAAGEAPEELDGVELVEKLGQRIPLDVEFKDETGAPVTLGSLLNGEDPVILTFNYSACEVLCSVQLGGLLVSLNQLDWKLGDEYRVITIGLNPMETHRRAMDTKMRYLDRYSAGPVELADQGWRFLTGSEEATRKVADAVGYGYRFNEKTGDYLHPAALTILSPDGVVSSYVYGVEYPTAPLAVTLLAARQGQLTEATQKFILSCFHYESRKGAAAVAVQVMKIGGAVFLVFVLAAFGTARVVRSRNQKRARVRQSEST